jgi:hypothetical protein
LRTADEWKKWLTTAAAFHQYSFRNAVLIALQMPQATSVAGYSSWKKLGRHVMERQKSIRIFAPVFSRSSKVQEEGKVAATRIDHELVDEARLGSMPKGRRLVGFRVAHVWDVSQTGGEPLPDIPQPAPVTGTAPVGLWEELGGLVREAGFTLSVEPIRLVDTLGYTDHSSRRVVISDSLDKVAAVACLAHEVAHMVMHSPEEVAAAGSVMCRGLREVEAESVAFMLLAHHGLRTDGASFPYVTGWASTVDQKEPERVVQRTGQRVVVTARELIELTSVQIAPGQKATAPARSLVRSLNIEATFTSADSTSLGI